MSGQQLPNIALQPTSLASPSPRLSAKTLAGRSMTNRKRLVVFLLGPSGTGKSTLSASLAQDAALLHIEIDQFPNGGGIDIAGLRMQWDSFLAGGSAGSLVTAIMSKVESAGARGAVLSFPSRLVLNIDRLTELHRAGVTSVVLYGSVAKCLAAFVEHEKRLPRVDGDPTQHWLANSSQTHIRFGLPEFEPFRLPVFRNYERVPRAALVAEVQRRAAA